MNKTNLKNTKSTFFKLVAYLFVGVLFACVNDPKEIEALADQEGKPLQSIKEAEIHYSSKGLVVAQLNAPTLNNYEGEEGQVEYSEMPDGVEVKIFDSLLQVTTRLTSNYAIDSGAVGKMEARDDVVVINEKGEQLNTEHLVWDKETEKITSDVYVKITTDGQVLEGEGLIANQDFSNYRILKPTGSIDIEND